MPVCKLCRQDRVLVRSHIIPDAFNRALKGDADAPEAKLEGVNEVKFFLAGAVMHVKVDRRPYPAPFPELILRAGGHLVVIARELEGSKDILALRPALETAAARARTRSRS